MQSPKRITQLLNAWEAYAPVVRKRSEELVVRGWTHAEAVECAEFEVMPEALRRDLAVWRAA